MEVGGVRERSERRRKGAFTYISLMHVRTWHELLSPSTIQWRYFMKGQKSLLKVSISPYPNPCKP
jgi:hypothetical protein